MSGKLQLLWERVRSSYWFVPSIMAAAAIVLAIIMLELDHRVSLGADGTITWLYGGSAEGARSLLSTVASSMVTVGGVTFSMTIVVLSLASSQFGPRIIKNYLRDTGNQFVLGTFIATFLYCVIVLRAVRGPPGAQFVPNISVTGGAVLAMLSLAVLIYFLHHVAELIQVENIVATASRDARSALDPLFPSTIGRERSAGPPPQRFTLGRAATRIPADRAGYVQALDGDALLRLAREKDVVIEVRRSPGHFVLEGEPLARVYGKGLSREECRKVASLFFLGDTRTPLHDADAALRQIVEIAVRALSPSLNDPFTAMACLDRIGAALCGVAERNPPSRFRYDREATLRVIARPVGFRSLADTAFNLIRQYGRSNAEVLLRILRTLERIARCSRRKDVHTVLLRHATLVLRETATALPVPEDRQRVRRKAERLIRRLERSG